MAEAAISATRFRADLYRFLDQVITTGQPLEVVLRGRKVRIVPAKPQSKLVAMKPRAHYIVGEPDSLLQSGGANRTA
jgi:prevent-host-death family protein